MLPILFLYRQALENTLKTLLPNGHEFNHDLKRLTEEIEKRHGKSFPEGIRKVILEFDAVDKKGDAFRYTSPKPLKAKPGKPKPPEPGVHFGNDIWGNVLRLRHVFDDFYWVVNRPPKMPEH